MTNERLRSALTSAGLSPRDLAERVQVDVKTVERWITNGRPPHRRTRAAVSALLHLDEHHLWPEATSACYIEASTQQEFVAFHPNRNAIPPQRWLDLAAGATEAIDIWAFAASFLHDSLDGFFEIVADRAAAGVAVRLLFGDPSSEAVKLRGVEEGLGDGFRWPLLEQLAISGTLHLGARNRSQTAQLHPLHIDLSVRSDHVCELSHVGSSRL